MGLLETSDGSSRAFFDFPFGVFRLSGRHVNSRIIGLWLFRLNKHVARLRHTQSPELRPPHQVMETCHEGDILHAWNHAQPFVQSWDRHAVDKDVSDDSEDKCHRFITGGKGHSAPKMISSARQSPGPMFKYILHTRTFTNTRLHARAARSTHSHNKVQRVDIVVRQYIVPWLASVAVVFVVDKYACCCGCC